MIPKRMWLENEHLINNAVQDVIRRMTGGSAEAIATHGIEHESIPGDFRGCILVARRPSRRFCLILWTRRRWGLLGMKRYIICTTRGLFTDEEWNAR